ncbi:hypothetical protein B0I33_11654 [Prauserella shujinwangii]|uniref:34 kDa antigenic protein n=1 Tax=Prauserella shujinwangii TaxID=1453103 RepID=A0A2T0LKD4_9PSEU|nr:DUF5336 domain-containing protein [Prauserella shujinwangii]PRX43321.1 hypothetical protein B0I33_11654 [Prauserella shujinwangii]
MTFPSGAPGGFPGQGPHQPQQPYPGAAPSTGGGAKLGLPELLYLAIAGVGVLNLFLGFVNADTDSNFYEVGLGWVPGLLLLSGITAASNILPGDQKPGVWPAAFAAAAMLPYLFTVFYANDLQAGGILVLIFGILQLLAAVVVYLFDVGILKPPAPQAAPYGGPGPYGQQQYGQQPGPFGQQQYGQQQPQQQGGEQPTKFAQPVNQPVNQPGQQPTQYASQQGQFYHQQQSGEGGQQQKPGTPPGGFGQPGS